MDPWTLMEQLNGGLNSCCWPAQCDEAQCGFALRIVGHCNISFDKMHEETLKNRIHVYCIHACNELLK